MRKKRILSTLLAVSMMSTMFAGCGQTQEEVVENSTVSSVTSEAESSAESSSEAESNTENSLDEIPESLKSPVQTWVDACVNGGSDKDYGVDAAIDMVKFMLAAYQSDKEKGKRVTI